MLEKQKFEQKNAAKEAAEALNEFTFFNANNLSKPHPINQQPSSSPAQQPPPVQTSARPRLGDYMSYYRQKMPISMAQPIVPQAAQFQQPSMGIVTSATINVPENYRSMAPPSGMQNLPPSHFNTTISAPMTSPIYEYNAPTNGSGHFFPATSNNIGTTFAPPPPNRSAPFPSGDNSKAIPDSFINNTHSTGNMPCTISKKLPDSTSSDTTPSPWHQGFLRTGYGSSTTNK